LFGSNGESFGIDAPAWAENEKAPSRGPLVGCVCEKRAAACRGGKSQVSGCQEERAQKSPARFPGRAQFVSFNFVNNLICGIASSVVLTLGD